MGFQSSISFSPQLGIRRVRRSEEWNPRIQASLRYFGFLLHICSHGTCLRCDILTLSKFCIRMKQQLLVGLQDFYYKEKLLPIRKKKKNLQAPFDYNLFKIVNQITKQRKKQHNPPPRKSGLALWFLAWSPGHYSSALAERVSVFMRLSLQVALRIDLPVEVNSE